MDGIKNKAVELFKRYENAMDWYSSEQDADQKEEAEKYVTLVETEMDALVKEYMKLKPPNFLGCKIFPDEKD